MHRETGIDESTGFRAPVQPLGKTIWLFLKDRSVNYSELLSSTPWGYTNKVLTHLYTNTHWDIKQSRIAKREKQPKCLSADKCSKKCEV